MSSRIALRFSLLVTLATAGCGANDAGAPGAPAAPTPDFTGVWSGAFTTQKNEYWELEDLTACFTGCTPTARAYYASLIEDPQYDSVPVRRLWDMTTVFMRQELGDAELFGFVVLDDEQALLAWLRIGLDPL